MMPKKPYTGNYSKRKTQGPPKAMSAGLGSNDPPIQYDANQIASPNQSYKKGGAKNARPSMRR